MSNSFYNVSGAPSAGSAGSSAVVRAEYAAVAAGFDKFPALSTSALKVWRTDAGGTSVEAVTVASLFTGIALSGITDLTTTGNTILGDAATDTLNVGNGGLIKDASGNVGIGAAPSTKVDVAVTGGMLRIGGSAGNNLVQAYTGGGVGLGLWAGGDPRLYASGGLSVYVGTTLTTGAPTGGLSAMTIDASGNVGIGVTPTNTLHARGSFRIDVNGATDSIAAFGGGAGLAYFGPTTATALAVLTSGAERMRIDTSGNVGIGVTPVSLLHTSGVSPTWNHITSSGNAILRLADSPSSGTRKEFTITLDNANNRVDIQAIQQGVATRDITINASGGNLNVGSVTNDFGGVIYAKKAAGVATIDVFSASTSEAKFQLLNNNNSSAIGNGSGGELVFYASPRTAERMRIDSAGDVGIGIAPGGSRLQIYKAAAQTLSAITADAAQTAVLAVAGNGNTIGATSFDFLQANDSAAYVFQRANAALLFGTNNAERMRIDAAGLVGIANSVVGGYQLALGGLGNVRMLNATNTSGFDVGLLAGSGSAIGYVYNRANASLIFGTNNIDRVTIAANGATTFTSAVTAASFSGDGSALTALNATQLTSGTVPAARIGGATAYDISASTVNGNAVGYRGLPAASVTTGAFVAADAGKIVNATAGVTVPNATMAAGDSVAIFNNTAGNITITATVATLYQAGTANTGNRTLAQRGIATVYFVSGTVAVISGAGLT